MFLLLIFIFGLFLGSFLNVLIDRLPRGESVFFGRSHCEKCKKNLAWYDLIPLLSFIFLKGRCRYCHTPLSFFYPVVEVITGILFALTFVYWQQNGIMNQESGIMGWVLLFYYLFIISSLSIVFFVDLKYGIIPDKILLPAVLTTLLYLFIIHNSLFMIQFLSGIGAFLFFLSIFLITKGRGMGFGDVKLSFLLGLLLGFPNIIVALYIAFLTGAIVGCILIVWKKKRLHGTKIPFGPFLVLGTLVTMFLGDQIIKKALSILFPI